MISIGIDAVDINRFDKFSNYKEKQLEKIFSKQEIEYCMEHSAKSCERFASRFAAKEAFYKAIYPLLKKHITLFKACQNVEVLKEKSGLISLKINFGEFSLKNNIIISSTSLSITHTKSLAIAALIIN